MAARQPLNKCVNVLKLGLFSSVTALTWLYSVGEKTTLSCEA